MTIRERQQVSASVITTVHVKQRERGATLILITFVATFVLIPVVGLAIDGTLLFWMQGRLSAAVDSAALAAGRSLNVGLTEAAQEANATVIAQQYFAANFPAGLMRSTVVGGAPAVVFTIPSTHVRTVQVTASAIVPLFFMPMLQFNTGTIAATGTASRRDANIILVLDRSGSMNNASGSCPALVSSAKSFVTRFANGRDRLGLVTFSTAANIDFPPSLTFDTDSPNLSNVLTPLFCIGGTSTAEGLYAAHQLLMQINQPGALNVIVLFTDGSPSSIFAAFPVKTFADTRYDANATSVSVAVPASSCASASPLMGVLADTSDDEAPTVLQLQATGYTIGLYSPAGVPLSSTADPLMLSTATNCSFLKQGNIYARQDVAFVPAADTHGDPTNGTVYPVPAADFFPSSNTNYGGQIRPDVPRTQRFVAFNAADAQATVIHNDTAYAPVIYTIGLAGNEQMAMNQNFMERLANDPRANNYDKTKPQGQFILATDNAGVAAAFNEIASQVLRLSK